MSISIPNQNIMKNEAVKYAVNQVTALKREFNLLEVKIRTATKDAYEAGYKQAWKDKP